MNLDELIFLGAAMIYATFPSESSASDDKMMEISIKQSEKLWKKVCNRDDGDTNT